MSWYSVGQDSNTDCSNSVLFPPSFGLLHRAGIRQLNDVLTLGHALPAHVDPSPSVIREVFSQTDWPSILSQRPEAQPELRYSGRFSQFILSLSSSPYHPQPGVWNHLCLLRGHCVPCVTQLVIRPTAHWASDAFHHQKFTV